MISKDSLEEEEGLEENDHAEEREEELDMAWTYLRTYITLDEAKQAKNRMPVKYSSIQSSIIRSGTTWYYQCKQHKDCPSQIRIIESNNKFTMRIMQNTLKF